MIFLSYAGRDGEDVVGVAGQGIGAGLVETGAGQVGRSQYGEAGDHAGGGLGQFSRERVQFARGDV